MLHGVNLCAINYLYICVILAGAAWLLRGMTNPFGWAMLSGVFGLLFGLLCAPVDVEVVGPMYAFSWWMIGIAFDIIHCGANFIMALVLFAPLRKILERLYRETQRV